MDLKSQQQIFTASHLHKTQEQHPIQIQSHLPKHRKRKAKVNKSVLGFFYKLLTHRLEDKTMGQEVLKQSNETNH